MSRIGRLPIPVPSGVDVTIDGRNVTVTGPKGSLSRALHPDMTVSREDGTIVVGPEALARYLIGPDSEHTIDLNAWLRSPYEPLPTLIAAAKRIYAPKAKWSPASLALFTQAALQGAFILAKAKHGPQIAAECIDHLQRYIETQLPPTKT